MSEPNIMEQLHVEKLTCDSLVIESKDRKSKLEAVSFDNGVGLWLTKGDLGVTMYSVPGQDAVIAAYNQKENHEGHQFAFWVDDKGNPNMQVIKNGKFKSVDLSKLPV